MSHDLVLIIALALPALLLVFLRVNAAMVFLSLCLGAVLVDHVAVQAGDLLGLFTPDVPSFSRSTIELALLLAPAIVTAVVTLFSIHGKLKSLLNIIPAAAASMLAVLLAVPLLSLDLMDQGAWRVLANSEALIVGAGALVSLFFLWSQRRSFRKPGK